MKSNKESKKVAAISLAAVVIAGGIGAALGAYIADDSKQLEYLQEKVAELQQNVVELENAEPVVETVVEVQEVEKVVEITKEILVDNENLDKILQFAYDNDGNVSLLTSGLKESEIDQVVERLLFLNDVEALTLESARQDLLDLVHNRQVSGRRIRASEVSRMYVDEDSLSKDVLSFKHSDAVGQVTVTFEADDRKYEAVIEVEVKDGSVSESKVVSIVRI